MKVFKFGGASVKNAEGVKNIATILLQQNANNIVVVVSAMGKTTNAFEKVLTEYFNNSKNTLPVFLSFYSRFTKFFTHS